MPWEKSSWKGISVNDVNISGLQGTKMNHEYAPSVKAHIGTNHAQDQRILLG